VQTIWQLSSVLSNDLTATLILRLLHRALVEEGPEQQSMKYSAKDVDSPPGASQSKQTEPLFSYRQNPSSTTRPFSTWNSLPRGDILNNTHADFACAEVTILRINWLQANGLRKLGKAISPHLNRAKLNRTKLQERPHSPSGSAFTSRWHATSPTC
jgi:hypothetical protein